MVMSSLARILHYGLNEIIGTTYTPSSLLTAALLKPQITHRFLAPFPPFFYYGIVDFK